MSIGIAIIGSGIFVQEEHLAGLLLLVPKQFANMSTAQRKSMQYRQPQSHILPIPKICQSIGDGRCRPLLR